MKISSLILPVTVYSIGLSNTQYAADEAELAEILINRIERGEIDNEVKRDQIFMADGDPYETLQKALNALTEKTFQEMLEEHVEQQDLRVGTDAIMELTKSEGFAALVQKMADLI